MLTVACVKWGDKYGPEYVHRLQTMVQKNLSVPHRFVCFTENPQNLSCETIALTEELEIYWNKLQMFKPGVLTGQCLYFDLDVVIQQDVTGLVKYDDKLYGIYTAWDTVITDGSDPTSRKRWRFPFNSSCMRWKAEEWHHVWDKFDGNRDYYLIEYDGGGDDKFLAYEIEGKGTFDDIKFYSRLHGANEEDCKQWQRIHWQERRRITFYYPEYHVCLFDGKTTEEHYNGFERYWDS